MNRIIYVDPSDVRINKDGGVFSDDEVTKRFPVTPDYTEMCVSCILIVEYSSRLKNQFKGTNNTETAVMVSDLNYNEGYLSFMQGKDAEKYNFLTTDYTNINYNEIKKRNIIEGLQIENIDINYTNYQTPQITIKFVDVRGGGLFAREEATHDEHGNLYNLEANENGERMDNFFNCFVSFPYPRFKLQVKGFYGKPVTFQLTCTSFSANLNCNTGNFEFTVQFIGYEYGILGDIQFDLLLAAPYTEVGKAYWDTQVQNLEESHWGLDEYNKDEPVRLVELYNSISNAIAERVIRENDGTDALFKDSIEKIKGLTELKESIDNFKKLIKKSFGIQYVTEYNDENESVMVIYNPTKNGQVVSDDIINARNNIANTITSNLSLSSEDGIYKTIPNNTKGAKQYNEWEKKTITFDNFIEHINDKGVHKNKISGTNGKIIENPQSFLGTKVKKMFTNDDYEISLGLSQKIYEDLIKHRWYNYGTDVGQGFSFAPYATIISFGSIKQLIDNRVSTIRQEYKTQMETIENQKNERIQTMLKVKPYIGRYFKIVMCHFETFIHTIKECVDEIYRNLQDRTPIKLGIYNLEAQTDVPNTIRDEKGNNVIPPFPAVYQKYTTSEEKDLYLNSGRNIVANAWIGDFTGNWPEKKLVIEYNKAAKRVNIARKQAEYTSVDVEEIAATALMPIYYMTKLPKYAYTSEDGFLLYIGLFAEISLNLMFPEKKYDNLCSELNNYSENYNLVKGMGEACAHAYMTSHGGMTVLETIIEEHGKNLEDYFYQNTVYCDEFVKTRKEYEFKGVYKDRQPIFIETNGTLNYRYMRNKSNEYELIPLQSNNNISKNFYSRYYTYTDGNDFGVKNTASGGFLIASKESKTYEEPYTKALQIKVIKDIEMVKQIVNKISEMNIDETQKFRTTCLMNFFNVSYVSEEKEYKFLSYNSIMENFICNGFNIFVALNPNKNFSDIEDINKKVSERNMDNTITQDERELIKEALLWYDLPVWNRKS